MKGIKISLCVFYLDKITPLSKNFKDYFLSKIQYKTFKKGEFVSENGEVCNELYFIRNGMIRGFYMKGTREITTWLSTDNELVTSITGFFKNEEGRENIQALEDTFVEYIQYEDLQEALTRFPEMTDLYMKLLIEYYIHAERRAFLARIPSAAERFLYFLEVGNGFLLERAPHKYLASLLNMRPETFSRMIKDYQEAQENMASD